MKKKMTAVLVIVFITIVCLINFNENRWTVQKVPEAAWQPDGMKVELLSKPYGINSDSPAFSWYVGRNGEVCNQEAYQILLAKTYRQAEKGEYILDTGWQESKNNTYVKIKNIEQVLSDNDIFWWKVRVKDEEGNISNYSEPQCLSTKVGDEWESLDGIWNEEKSEYCFFRTEFKGKNKSVEKAILNVTALSPEETRQYVFNVYLNGEYVGSGPARLKQDKVNYNTFDVTQYVKKNNVLGAICYSNTNQTFMCQLTMFYKDGSKEVVVSSGRDIDKWKVLNGNEAYGKSDNMIGTSYYVAHTENISALTYPNGWLEEEYDDSLWNRPQVTYVFDKSKLYSYETENMEKYDVVPETVVDKGNGHYFVDFGKEIVGGIAIDIDNDNQKPTEVVFRYGEELDENGNVMYQMRTGNVYEEKWTLKSGEQEYENIGMKTFRYVDLYCENIKFSKDNIKGRAIRQAFDDAESEFVSSNQLLNDIYGLCKYTIKATNQNLYVDSQSRERGAYEGDLWINMMASYAFEDKYSLARVSLEYLEENRTWPAEYPMYAVMGAWQDYMYTGNIDSLVENYDNLKKNMQDVVIDEDYGLIKNNYDDVGYNRPLVDWPETERDNYAYDEAEYNTVVNAIGSYTYRELAKIADAIGEKNEAKEFLDTSKKIKTAMIKRLYNKEKGAFSDGLTKEYKEIEHYSQHATAYALYAGIFDNVEMKNSLVKYLKNMKKNKMSVFGSYFLLQGLYDNDAGEYATELLTSESDTHTWNYMLSEEKATITAEAWSTEIKDNMTYSHPWGASPAIFITQGIFGIKPLKPGFDEFQIKLQPGEIKKAYIRVPTIKGEISISYQLDQNMKFENIDIIVPANTRASVMFPMEYIDEDMVYINDQPVEISSKELYGYLWLDSGEYKIQKEVYEEDLK